MDPVIHAPNVHQGGGAVLLRSILLEAARHYPNLRAIVDARLQLPTSIEHTIVVMRAKPTVFGRLRAEWCLKTLVGQHTTVLCFGNLPPLFKVKARVIVYLQNRYLVGQVPFRGFPIVSRLRILVERLWLRWRIKQATKIIVQTASMRRETERKLRRSVNILPFCQQPDPYDKNKSVSSIAAAKIYDFVYVASGEPHKNHDRLLEAWKILAREGLYPSLCLTLDKQRCRRIVSAIRRAQADCGVKIDNIEIASEADVERLYQMSKALVYPSLLESFGLPLIETKRMGLPVIAAELDYVRDVADPIETFDPQSAISIARAVKRHLGIAEKPIQVVSPGSFLEKVLN